MGMMFHRNKLRRKQAEMEAVQTPVKTESVKDKVPEPKRRGRKPKNA